MTIKLVKEKYEKLLMRNPNVICVGTGSKANKEIIKIFVKQKAQEQLLKSEESIPGELDGFETDVEEIGEVTSLTVKIKEESLP
ncbi:MAG: hypothetical protein C4554_07085 [Dethiobacter sp.]|jgi:hypothetical protein|nr:MAG: hypothetical protein C4554_07085 [Dethiobacter sp.]